MATECAQVLSQMDKQKTPKGVPPTKNLCQPFTLRLILGVPILKEDSKVVADLSSLFTKYSTNRSYHQITDGNDKPTERDIFWDQIVIGVNSVVKRIEDAARESPSSTDFALVLLDFAWLNSQLGHHLAHLCSTTPHTSLVAVSPPGQLSKLIASSGQTMPKIACIGIHPLFSPRANLLSLLRDCMKTCSELTGKPLPPDPASGANTMLPPATPQYVPILPKPPTSVPSIMMDGISTLSNFLTPQQHSEMSSVMSTPGRKSQTPSTQSPVVILPEPVTNKQLHFPADKGGKILPQPGSSQTPMPKIPPKTSAPRLAVRHIPADDWLTYKLDHARLYKCGSDIAKELEDHSLYIHDVSDIWALYPRHFQKLDSRRLPSSGGPSTSHGGVGGDHTSTLVQSAAAAAAIAKRIKSKRKQQDSSSYADTYMDSPRRLSREERRERLYRKQMQQMKRSRQSRRQSPRW